MPKHNKKKYRKRVKKVYPKPTVILPQLTNNDRKGLVINLLSMIFIMLIGCAFLTKSIVIHELKWYDFVLPSVALIGLVISVVKFTYCKKTGTMIDYSVALNIFVRLCMLALVVTVSVMELVSAFSMDIGIDRKYQMIFSITKLSISAVYLLSTAIAYRVYTKRVSLEK